MAEPCGLVEGKKILITGGASGIGLEISRLLSTEGAQVLITDIDEDAGKGAVNALLCEGGRVELIKCDVTNEAEVVETVGSLETLDCLVNNAGIAGPHCELTDVSGDQLDQLLSINVKGTFLMMREAIRLMKPQGHGSIVNIASVGAMVGTSNLVPYTASKHAVLGLTRGATVEQSRHGIRVNAVCPGPTHTPMLEAYAETHGLTIDEIGSDLPLGRISKPSEVAEAVLWLCSDRSSATTGAVLTVDGGYTAQ